MDDKNFDEKINYILAEIDRLLTRLKTLESAEKVLVEDELNESSVNAVENGVVATAIRACAKRDASNLTSGDVESFNEKLGISAVVAERLIEYAKKDASNLTSGDIESFNEKLGTHKLEIIYDKNSLNNNLNWGQTGGIKGGIEVIKSTSFFGEYKGLYVYATCDNTVLKVHIDLMELNCAKNNYNGAGCGLSGSQNVIVCVKAEVDVTKSKFKCTSMGYFSSYFTILNNNNSYYIYKIEGLK